MLDFITYAAAVAAVNAGIGRLLSDDDWERFLSASTIDDFLSAASGTVYRNVIAEQPGDNIEEIERRLRQFLADHFLLPVPFLHGKARELIYWAWRQFEINNLIILLRALHNRMPATRIRASLVPLGRATEFNWHVLSNAASVSDVIGLIRITETGLFYARALQNAYHEYQRQDTVFVLGVALYVAFYRRIRKIINSLAGRDRKEAKRFIGTRIDSLNVLWAYRYRIFFRFAPETILGYTLPTGTRVDGATIQRAAAGAPLQEIVREIWDSELPDMEKIEDKSPRQALVELEIIFRRYFYRLADETFGHYPVHLGTILAYQVLLETEIDDLITLVEGIAYGWDADRIRPHMIVKRGRT